MKLLLTGGTGFLGRTVAHALTAAGHQVTLLVRGGRHLEGLAPGQQTVAGDVTDPASLTAALAGLPGVEAVVHMAAMVAMWHPDPAEFDAVNVQGLENVLDAARAAGVARVLYSSSFMALGPTGDAVRSESDDPARTTFFNDYERTKYLADQVARRRAAAGEPLVLVYPGVVYGPGLLTAGGLATRQILLFMQGKLPGILGPGDQSICYSYVHDVAAGCVAALERGRPGRGYILGGENATLNVLMAGLAGATGRPAPRLHIPYSVGWLMGRAQWWRAQLTGAQPELTHQVVNIYKQSWAYDSSRAREELGYTVTPLSQGLAATVAWLRETHLDR